MTIKHYTFFLPVTSPGEDLNMGMEGERDIASAFRELGRDYTDSSVLCDRVAKVLEASKHPVVVSGIGNHIGLTVFADKDPLVELGTIEEILEETVYDPADVNDENDELAEQTQAALDREKILLANG